MLTFLKQFIYFIDKAIGEERQNVLEKIIASSATGPADVERLIRQFERQGSNSFV